MRNAIALMDSVFRNLEIFPFVDIHEEKNQYVLRADLPGVNKDDIKLEYKDGILTLSGERSLEPSESPYFRRERPCGSFSRSFRFGPDISSETIKAEFKEGVLSIALPKREEIKAKSIAIA
jgi:HSP20 family protein